MKLTKAAESLIRQEQDDRSFLKARNVALVNASGLSIPWEAVIGEWSIRMTADDELASSARTLVDMLKPSGKLVRLGKGRHGGRCF